MIDGVEGKLKIVDDILLHGHKPQNSEVHVHGNDMEQLEASLLVRCREKNITLSR